MNHCVRELQVYASRAVSLVINRFNNLQHAFKKVAARFGESIMAFRFNRYFRALSIAMVMLLLSATAAFAQKVTVDADPAHVANTFSPVRALGAAIDRLRTGTPDHLLKDPLLHEILGAGWQTVTYRQNTELMVEAWHWNPTGKWSNAEKQEGYFVGTPELGEAIHHSWAAPLPHRG